VVRQTPDNRAKAITFTVALHLLLAAALILGIEFSDYRPLSGPKVDIIEAELVTRPPKPLVDPEAERRKRELEEQQRREEVEAAARRRNEAEIEQRRAEERQREAEAQRRQKAEQAERQKAEAKRKAVQEAKQQEAKKKAELEARKKAELDASKKAELAAKKQAEEEVRRKKAEDEARRKAEAEQQAREQAMLEALAQEQRDRELTPLRDAYSAAISQQIARNWLKPPGISDDLKCEALVIQMPDGNVTSAKITRSSGNAVFDESVIKAIYKAAPLPQPPSPEVFDRDLQIAFCSTGNVC
jgi:colicin import membrane protein